MAELVDPEKLVSVAQVAREYDYHPKYLVRIASTGKMRAWRIGNVWATTREHIIEYLKTVPSPGRPSRRAQKKHKNRT